MKICQSESFGSKLMKIKKSERSLKAAICIFETIEKDGNG